MDKVNKYKITVFIRDKTLYLKYPFNKIEINYCAIGYWKQSRDLAEIIFYSH